jgi:3-deoxy-D-manno-octulosonate 8-phosphate phosphatase (KDO 8-P phosphatase)
MDIKLKSKLKKISTFVFDVDGVMTDGTIIALRNGEMARIFNVKDGYIMGVAVRLGYRIVIISGGREESIRERLAPLGIKDIFLAVKTDKKLEVFDKYLIDNDLSAEECLFMGDDLPDIQIMRDRNVLAVCPNDAVDDIQQISDYIATKNGGKGAVREIIEMVLKEQGKWMNIL